MTVNKKPKCSTCGKNLPQELDLLRKIFLTYDESEYDKVLEHKVERSVLRLYSVSRNSM